MVKKTTWRRWSPTPETIDAMRTALGSHWVMATHAAPQTPFWPAATPWLKRQAYHFASGGRLIK